jgi:hypothetical protein
MREHRFDLRSLELAVLARRERAEFNLTDGDELDALHEKLAAREQGLEIEDSHTDERELEDGFALTALGHAHGVGLENTTVDLGAAREFVELGLVGMALDLDFVHTRDRGVLDDFFEEFAIIGKKDKTFAVEFHPADGEHARAQAVDKDREGRASFRIVGHHADYAAGLMEREVDRLLSRGLGEELSAHFDRVHGKIRLRA